MLKCMANSSSAESDAPNVPLSSGPGVSSTGSNHRKLPKEQSFGAGKVHTSKGTARFGVNKVSPDLDPPHVLCRNENGDMVSSTGEIVSEEELARNVASQRQSIEREAGMFVWEYPEFETSESITSAAVHAC